jgi:hypothetical protein
MEESPFVPIIVNYIIINDRVQSVFAINICNLGLNCIIVSYLFSGRSWEEPKSRAAPTNPHGIETRWIIDWQLK